MEGPVECENTDRRRTTTGKTVYHKCQMGNVVKRSHDLGVVEYTRD